MAKKKKQLKLKPKAKKLKPEAEPEIESMNLSDFDPVDPIFRLPPHKVDDVFVAASEIRDWGLTMLNIPSLWRHTKGRNINVAVLDSGVDFMHPDLEDNIAAYENFTNSPAGPADLEGHGTHVAGIIAARQNHQGIVGVAPEAKLLIAKVLDDNGAGTTNSVVDGIEWAVKNKADIISISFASQYAITRIHDAVKAAIDAGVFVIAAAGNDSFKHVDYPAAHDECIAVGAIDRQRRLSTYSSYTPDEIEVDIVAPGDDILSTHPTRKYARMSGTSMATPFVAGVVALTLSKHRDYGGATPITTQAELLEHLRETAIDLGPAEPDFVYGFGLVNPQKVVGLFSPNQAAAALYICAQVRTA